MVSLNLWGFIVYTRYTKFIKSFFLFSLLAFIFSTYIFSAADVQAEEVIVFSRLTDGYWQIWAMNPDGTKQTPITTTKIDKRDPVCTNNGKTILFRTNNGQLFMKNLSSPQEEEVLAKYQLINNPDVCPSTNEVIFVRFDPRETDISDIWKSDLEGKDTRILTKDKRLKYQPVFNATCDEIAFIKAAEKKTTHRVWLMSATGENPRQLTDGEEGFDALPDFLPDQKGVVFSSNRDGKDYEIYSIDLDGKNLTQITDNTTLDTSPAVSPQHSRMLFVSSRSGSQQVWRMNADGSDAVQLTNSAEEAVDPQWCEVPLNGT